MAFTVWIRPKSWVRWTSNKIIHLIEQNDVHVGDDLTAGIPLIVVVSDTALQMSPKH